MLGAIIGGKLIAGAANRIPGIDRLGVVKGPVVSLGLLLLAAPVTKRVEILRRYDAEIMLGLGLNLLTEIISAFAPASIRTMLGMGTPTAALAGYSQDYLGDAELTEDETSNYVITNGMDEDLELEEELELSTSQGIFGNKGMVQYDDGF